MHERAEWTKVIEAKLTQIERLHTWDLVEAPPDTNVIPSGYIFCQKHDSNRKIEHYKARCIAKGYMQQFGVDYTDTFSPTICLATL
jgi:Reverse transcriptase (RNA-dependent DNA polymerase)